LKIGKEVDYEKLETTIAGAKAVVFVSISSYSDEIVLETRVHTVAACDGELTRGDLEQRLTF
jgi:hypothetical protein